MAAIFVCFSQQKWLNVQGSGDMGAWEACRRAAAGLGDLSTILGALHSAARAQFLRYAPSTPHPAPNPQWIYDSAARISFTAAALAKTFVKSTRSRGRREKDDRVRVYHIV